MPRTISAEANQNSVEVAENLENTQSESAEALENSVDSTEPIENSSEESPDIMSMLLDDGEASDTDKSVPEAQYLKLKIRNKSMKDELERLRGMVASKAPYPQAPLPPAAEPPDPDKFEDGALDPKYQAAYFEYQKAEMAKVVKDQLVQKNAELENTAYLSKYQERLDRAVPIANQKVEGLMAKNAEFKARMSSPYIQDALTKLPPEIAVAIVEGQRPEAVFDYYSRKPDKLVALTQFNMDEVLNLGKILGKIESVKGTRKQPSKPITPIKAGDSSNKWHPFKDYDKWDHNNPADHKKWEKAVEENNKRRQ